MHYVTRRKVAPASSALRVPSRFQVPGFRFSAALLSAVSCQLSVGQQLSASLLDLVDEDSVVLFGGDVCETIIG